MLLLVSSTPRNSEWSSITSLILLIYASLKNTEELVLYLVDKWGISLLWRGFTTWRAVNFWCSGVFEPLFFFTPLLTSASLQSSPANPTRRPRGWWRWISVVVPSLICLILSQDGPQSGSLHAFRAAAAPKFGGACCTRAAQAKGPVKRHDHESKILRRRW